MSDGPSKVDLFLEATIAPRWAICHPGCCEEVAGWEEERCALLSL